VCLLGLTGALQSSVALAGEHAASLFDEMIELSPPDLTEAVDELRSLKHEIRFNRNLEAADRKVLQSRVRYLKKRVAWWKLFLTGVGLAPLELFLGITIHEGSHALWAKAMGATILEFKPWPHVDRDGFYFGAMVNSTKKSWSAKNHILIYAAPMVTDAVVLMTYGGLVLSDALPENKYAQMVMFVFAAGHLVDMTNHMVARNKHTDTAMIEKLLVKDKGWKKWQARLMMRGSQAVMITAGTAFLIRGAMKIFEGTFAKKRKLKIIRDFIITPDVDGTAVGLSASGRF